MDFNDNIIALATPSGAGAIGVLRISGPEAIAVAALFFRSVYGKSLARQKSHTIALGHIVEGERLYDQVLASVFKAPNSYTGENVVEISCHGSSYVQSQIMQLFLRNGCRTAEAGEFTLRAFLNGKLDLSQAEAVADLIAADNEASHTIAIQQMRGGFGTEIKKLREELLNFASLIELELDFAEEDVEFADRSQFKKLVAGIQEVLKRLIDSFAVGNVIKNGIPVAIVGEPNVGKSTLLNALLNEERAIVSEIAGTTRDTIEDEITIGGFGFRFIDTAGIRVTEDVVEAIGIKKTFEKIGKAQVVIYLVDGATINANNHLLEHVNAEFEKLKNSYPQKTLVLLINKKDALEKAQQLQINEKLPSAHFISAKTGEGLDDFKNMLTGFINAGVLKNNETIVTNTRHYNSLLKAFEALDKVKQDMDDNLPSDLMAIDLKDALYHLGEITGQVTNDELLGNIFANFCIGK